MIEASIQEKVVFRTNANEKKEKNIYAAVVVCQYFLIILWHSSGSNQGSQIADVLFHI